MSDECASLRAALERIIAPRGFDEDFSVASVFAEIRAALDESAPTYSADDYRAELTARVAADPFKAGVLLSHAYSYISEAYRRHFNDDVREAYLWTQEGELGDFLYPNPVSDSEVIDNP